MTIRDYILGFDPEDLQGEDLLLFNIAYQLQNHPLDLTLQTVSDIASEFEMLMEEFETKDEVDE